MFNRGSRKTERLMIWAIVFSTLFIFSSFAYASGDELGEVIHAIKSKGKQWIAAETSISKLHPAERKKRLGAIIPSHVSEKELLSRPHQVLSEPVVGAPTTFDWSNYVTPARDQGGCGSCWAFATTAAIESQVLISQNTPGTVINLSEQVLVSCGNAGDCGGGSISSASNFIRDTGLPVESCYPYAATDGLCSNACQNWQDNTYQITNWHWVATTTPTVDALKNALYQYGPMPTTMDVYTDFFYYSGGIYSYTSGSYEGGHAILIVGYDDPGQYFIAKNSWSTDWGESGYFRIAYSELNGTTGFGSWSIAYEGFDPSPDPETITVTLPNGGESWQVGTTQTIYWSYTGTPGSYVKIELLKGGVLNSTITLSTPIGSGGSGSYTWAIPSTQTAGTDYKIKVTSTSNSAYTDTSNNNFTISSSPTITVTSPNGGESWYTGTTQTIRWNYTGSPGSYVKIELFKGGVLNTTITSSTSIGSGGSGSYNWTIPSTQTPGSDYKIRVTSTSNSSYTDESNSYFTITASPTITVTSPNGGESWYTGTTQTIRWNYTGTPGPYVKIELFKGGVLNTTITSSTSIGSGGSGSYTWAISSTQTPGTDYKIRVTSTSNSAYTDESNNNFTITAAPTITVSSPNGGETWYIGTTQTIRWTYTGNPGSYLKIELLKGGVVTNVITSGTSIGSSGSGSYSWTIPSTVKPNKQYKIRVTSTSNGACSDISNQNFTIRGLSKVLH